MKRGLHCYCEKPLAHSIHEVRVMRDMAAKMKVATQMGNQGHSYDGHRRAVETIQAGILGKVREVHVWTDRPIWPQGIDRPKDSPTIPSTLHWDLWLGPAAARPYHPAYHPFKWRGFWDFGTGALGDMACHNADVAFWGLNLGYPTLVEAEPAQVNSETAPTRSTIHYHFPARGDLPPVKLTWYDGKGNFPPRDLFEANIPDNPLIRHGRIDIPARDLFEANIPDNGCLLVGDKGKLLAPDWHADKYTLHPQKDFAGFTAPTQTIPRTTSHHAEWIAACKGGPPALSNFNYAAVLTESVLLGNLALRTGKKIEWDAANMKARNCPEADPYIKPEFRKGWSL
jgi:hypothetical protein